MELITNNKWRTRQQGPITRIRDLPGFSVFDNTRCGLITHTLRVHKTPEYHKEKFQPNLLEINSLGKNSNSKNGCVRKTKDRWILLKTKEKKGKREKQENKMPNSEVLLRCN